MRGGTVGSNAADGNDGTVHCLDETTASAWRYRVKAFLRRWFGGSPGLRVSGRPTSSNQASSFHLIWEMPRSEPMTAVSAVITIVEPPSVGRLYFWALQASFSDGTSKTGGAHLGLQWHPGYPGLTAVNWGGYRAAGRGGGELDGSVSELPSALGNPNTRDFSWRAGSAYRLRIAGVPDRPGAWQGSVEDLDRGQTTVVRELWAGGSRLTDPVVWSEVFADCGHPPAAARWGEFAGETAGGSVRPTGIRVNYQTNAAGGCDNTNVIVTSSGIVQRTATVRTIAAGTRFEWSG
jgi:hypothetical protein